MKNEPVDEAAPPAKATMVSENGGIREQLLALIKEADPAFTPHQPFYAPPALDPPAQGLAGPTGPTSPWAGILGAPTAKIVMLVDKCGMVAGTRASICGRNRTQWKLDNGNAVQMNQRGETWALIGDVGVDEIRDLSDFEKHAKHAQFGPGGVDVESRHENDRLTDSTSEPPDQSAPPTAAPEAKAALTNREAALLQGARRNESSDTAGVEKSLSATSVERQEQPMESLKDAIVEENRRGRSRRGRRERASAVAAAVEFAMQRALRQ